MALERTYAGPAKLEWQCFSCRLCYSFYTQPRERAHGADLSTRGCGYQQAALSHVLNVAVSNFVYDKYATYHILNGLLPVPPRSFQRQSNTLIWPTIVNIAEELMAEARQRAVQRGLPIILCFDGGWAHRGFHSSSVIDF